MSKSILNFVLMLATPPQHRIDPNGSPRIVATFIPRMQGTSPVMSVEESIRQPKSPVFHLFPELFRISFLGLTNKDPKRSPIILPTVPMSNCVGVLFKFSFGLFFFCGAISIDSEDSSDVSDVSEELFVIDGIVFTHTFS